MISPPGRPDSPQLARHWPLAGLRLRMTLAAAAGGEGKRLELRLPDDNDLAALATLAETGVHDPAVQPFAVAWTDAEPAARARSVLQYHWRCLGKWNPADWELNLAVICDGVVVGSQGVSATDYAS